MPEPTYLVKKRPLNFQILAVFVFELRSRISLVIVVTVLPFSSPDSLHEVGIRACESGVGIFSGRRTSPASWPCRSCSISWSPIPVSEL